MNRLLRSTVKAIAVETREWVQEKADRSGYNPNNLMGWCGIAAAELHKRLKKAGVESNICVYDYDGAHCYCVVEDHVVDVTATQFEEYKNEPVVIKHVKEAEVNYFHTGMIIFASASKLREFQKDNRWPSRQIAYA